MAVIPHKKRENPIKCFGIARKDKDLVKAALIKFIFGRIAPSWYQEMSDRQMNAADDLQNAIQEDIEEGTVYRCQLILRGLGVKPFIKPSEIRTMQKMSRGNDIAFLWFMYQIFYSKGDALKKFGEYSLNERLLLSTICHLDMVVTLRELDRILPKREIPPKTRKPKPSRPPFLKYSSLYLEPLPRPKIPRSKQLPRAPVPGPNFRPYTVAEDRYYVVMNELTRWYALKTDSKYDKTGQENFDKSTVLDSVLAEFKRDSRNDELMNILEVFRNSTNCACSKFKKCDPSGDAIVYPIDLELCRKRDEFERMVKKYRSQKIQQLLFKELIHFNAIKDTENFLLCTNCKDCKKAYDFYKDLVERNESLGESESFSSYLSVNYDAIIQRSIIGGSTNASKLLQELDKLILEDEEEICMCIKDAWQLESHTWADENFETQLAANEKNTENNEQINPRNSQQMDSMLKNALARMAANPKFVLASLPQAYCLPLLQEWIRVRYGFVYTENERKRLLVKSRKRWDKLLQLVLCIRPPQPKDLSEIAMLNYGYKERMEKCVKPLYYNYFNRFNVALINDALRFWPTMEPYLCSIGAPRELFYAYLPACEYDCLPFRPWKAFEFKAMTNKYCICP